MMKIVDYSNIMERPLRKTFEGRGYLRLKMEHVGVWIGNCID